MRRISSLIVALLLFSPQAVASEPFRFPEGKHGKGELKYVHGFPVLIVKGSPEEIGEQMGVLGVRPAAGAVTAFKALLKEQKLDLILPLLRQFGNRMLAKYPDEYKREFEALAKHSGIDRDLLLIGNTYSEIRHLAGCSGVMVDARRSATGGPLFGRNFDFPPLLGLLQYQMLIVYRPAGKKPFAVVSFPGGVAVSAESSAFNADGLAIGGNLIQESADKAPQVDWTKIPSAVACRRLLEECATIADAVNLAKANHPAERGALVMCDRAGGAVLELTPKTIVLREGTDGICFASNFFQSKELAVTPLPRCWRAEAFQKTKWNEKIGPEDVAKLMRTVCQASWTVHSLVFEPKTLKLRIAFGDGKKSATENKLTEIDLGELLTR